MNIPTDIWVAALIRRANLDGAFAVVSRRGDARAGAVLVRVWNSRAQAMKLFSEALDAQGRSVWIRPTPSSIEADITAFVERAIGRDPDIWVVDIEDQQGRHFLVEPVHAD
jgi:hypothetical protein